MVDYYVLLVMDSDSRFFLTGGEGSVCFFFATPLPRRGSFDLSRTPSPPPACRGEVKAECDNDEWVGADSFVASPYLQVGDSLATDWST